MELVARIENQLGALTEAVRSLKDQVKDQGGELKSVTKDIHAAKVVGAVIGVGAGVLGWAVAQLMTYLNAHPPK